MCEKRGKKLIYEIVLNDNEEIERELQRKQTTLWPENQF